MRTETATFKNNPNSATCYQFNGKDIDPDALFPEKINSPA